MELRGVRIRLIFILVIPFGIFALEFFVFQLFYRFELFHLCILRVVFEKASNDGTVIERERVTIENGY